MVSVCTHDRRARDDGRRARAAARSTTAARARSPPKTTSRSPHAWRRRRVPAAALRGRGVRPMPVTRTATSSIGLPGKSWPYSRRWRAWKARQTSSRRVAGRRHAQLVALPDVAQVGGALDGDVARGHAVLGSCVAHLRLQRGARSRGTRSRVDRAPHHELRRDGVVAQVGRQQAERRGEARERRHDHLAHLEQRRDLDRVQRPGAAERHQRVLARVEAALDRHAADRVGHVGVEQRQHALRRRLAGRARARSARSPTTACAASASSCIAPPRKRSGSSRPSTTCASVTVGSVPPRPYAAGPGLGAGAARADAEGAALVDVGDRAAAGADRLRCRASAP